VEAALAAFGRLELRDRSRASFVARFSRERIMRAMADDVLSLFPRGTTP
jgi:hypothetical protein